MQCQKDAYIYLNAQRVKEQFTLSWKGASYLIVVQILLLRISICPPISTFQLTLKEKSKQSGDIYEQRYQT